MCSFMLGLSLFDTPKAPLLFLTHALLGGAFVRTVASMGSSQIPQCVIFVAYYSYKRVISGALDAWSAYSGLFTQVRGTGILGIPQDQATLK